jgi:D-alanyl-D-alanine carboxypeptidase (penicillin-binding protein 5/6)
MVMACAGTSFATPPAPKVAVQAAKAPVPPVPPPPAPKPGLTPFRYVPQSWPVISAEAAVLIDADTGQFLYAHNAHRRMYPASLTKMMTALLAVERGNLQERLTIGQACLQARETSLNLRPGEHLTLEQLLYGMLLPSANDAAAATAEAISGTVPAFVEQMNLRAGQLGLRDTHFANPHGLHDPNHYSSAWDLAVIAREVMSHPELRKITATHEEILPWEGKPWSRTVTNRNRLLFRWAQCDGVKTGYTKPAGRCLAASASWNGWRLICVVLKARDSWGDAERLLTWGAANYYPIQVVARGATMTVPVRHGVAKSVAATVDGKVTIVAVRGQTVTPAWTLEPQAAEAPVRAGAKLGELAISAPGEPEQRVAVTAADSVERSFWAKLSDYRMPAIGQLALIALAAGGLAHGAASKASRKGGSGVPEGERDVDLLGESDDRRRGRSGTGRAR